MSERLFLRLEEDALHGPESSTPPGTLAAFPVVPALRASVAHVLLYRESLPGDVETCERVLPDGTVRLVFDLGAASSAQAAAGSPALAIGASASPVVVRMRGRTEGLSIGLRPGAAASLLGLPAGELTSRVVSLDDLWRGEATELLERLATATADDTRVTLVQTALERRLRGARVAPEPAARHAATLVAAAAGRRRLRSLRRGLAPVWASVAVDHGFYDQSHLVNEFRALCGITPAELWRRTTSGSSKTSR
jgi:AraC-like DNA-binding protein